MYCFSEFGDDYSGIAIYLLESPEHFKGSFYINSYQIRMILGTKSIGIRYLPPFHMSSDSYNQKRIGDIETRQYNKQWLKDMFEKAYEEYCSSRPWDKARFGQ